MRRIKISSKRKRKRIWTYSLAPPASSEESSKKRNSKSKCEGCKMGSSLTYNLWRWRWILYRMRLRAVWTRVRNLLSRSPLILKKRKRELLSSTLKLKQSRHSNNSSKTSNHKSQNSEKNVNRNQSICCLRDNVEPNRLLLNDNKWLG